jgi:hypothetical protein
VTIRQALAAQVALAVGLMLFGCSGTGTSTHDPALCAAPGGAVAGAADLHCDPASGGTVQVVTAASCQPGMPMDMDGGTMMDMDGGMPVEGAHDPRFNSEGDDDDCKYHVTWTASSVCAGADVTFNVAVTRKADGQPATGAAPHAEVLLSDTHPGPNTDQQAIETSPGTYQVGPVRFDASGTWTARFHLYEDCADTLPDSPHGHVAFRVNVP